jgi:hypothetical protein
MYKRPPKHKNGQVSVWAENARLKKHVAELEEALDRIRRMHNNGESDFLAPGKWCAGCGQVYPCDTIKVLRGTKK